MRHLLFLAGLCLSAFPGHSTDSYRAALENFFEAEIKDWQQDLDLVEAIREQNARTEGLSEAEVIALDNRWRNEVGGDNTPTITPVISNELAKTFQTRVKASDGAITEIFAVDAIGLNVAASTTTFDYWQGDEAKHQRTFGTGGAAVHFSEIEFEESTQAYQAQISFTVIDPENDEPIGSVTVSILAEALL